MCLLEEVKDAVILTPVSVFGTDIRLASYLWFQSNWFFFRCKIISNPFCFLFTNQSFFLTLDQSNQFSSDVLLLVRCTMELQHCFAAKTPITAARHLLNSLIRKSTNVIGCLGLRLCVFDVLMCVLCIYMSLARKLPYSTSNTETLNSLLRSKTMNSNTIFDFGLQKRSLTAQKMEATSCSEMRNCAASSKVFAYWV